MMNSIPPRLRTPAKLVVASAPPIAVAVAVYGWTSVTVLVPLVLILAAGYYVWGGRDSDMGAVIRRQPDERQVSRQLQAQALVGKVMSLAVVVAYLVAFGMKATLWPFALLVALPALTLFAGWMIYRDGGVTDSRELKIDGDI